VCFFLSIEAKGAVRAMGVVMLDIDEKDALEVTSIDDQETVEGFAADRRDRDPSAASCPAGPQGVR